MRPIIILIAIVIATAAGSSGATYFIPIDFPTIQAAISDSTVVTGDIIIVMPGTYVENINFIGKAITVKSDQGAAVTIIDGNQAGSVVTFNTGEGPGSVLDDFTITNGSGTIVGPTNFCGGGIFCESASPTLSNNIITENITDFGGGIWGMKDCSPVITGNTISKNAVTREGAGMMFSGDCTPLITNNIVEENTADLFGGGMEFWNNCTPTVANNIVKGNTAVQHGGGGIIIANLCSGTLSGNTVKENSAVYGGGILCDDNSDLKFSDNTITENQSATHGGGIYCVKDTPSIIGNTVSLNTAGSGSGGIYVGGSSNPEILFNIIDGNKALAAAGGGIAFFDSCGTISDNIITDNSSAMTGGGIVCIGYSVLTVTNNIITGNSTGIGGGIDAFDNCTMDITNNTIFGNSASNTGGGIACRRDSTATITNTILWNNSATTGKEIHVDDMNNPSTVDIDYSDVEGGTASVFVFPGSTLIWGSNMIKANPLFVNAAIGDFHLTYPSPCKDTGTNSAPKLPAGDFEGDDRVCYGTADMGADEFYTHLYFTGNATPGGSVEIKMTGIPGTTPVGLFIGFSVYDPPFESMWGDWYVAYPWIPILLGAIPTPDGVLIIPGNIPGTPPGPYTLYMQAIIGDELTNLCVMEVK